MAKHHSAPSMSSNVLIDCITASTLLLLLCFGSRLSEQLDIVATPLFVSQLLCCYLLALNILKVWRNKETASVYPTSTKSSKSVRSKVSRIFLSCVTLIISVMTFHIVTILFGAPVIESMTETFHFSCLLTAASILPCVCLVGPSLDSWIRVWNGHTKTRETSREYGALLTSLCSLAGAWLGAFPIPLDWDRAWQVWPVSCLIGTVLGHCFGLLSSSVSLVLDQRYRSRSKVI